MGLVAVTAVAAVCGAHVRWQGCGKACAGMLPAACYEWCDPPGRRRALLDLRCSCPDRPDWPGQELAAHAMHAPACQQPLVDSLSHMSSTGSGWLLLWLWACTGLLSLPAACLLPACCRRRRRRSPWSWRPWTPGC